MPDENGGGLVNGECDGQAGNRVPALRINQGARAPCRVSEPTNAMIKATSANIIIRLTAAKIIIRGNCC